LGIDLDRGGGEIFKWFLASVLFGAPISEAAAKKTYRLLVASGARTPNGIRKKGWRGLVSILDSGGYTRYDFKTADKLLELSRNLMDEYGGDLERLHAASGSQDELELRLKALAKGIGDTTVGIFLREMPGTWDVRPKHSKQVMAAASRLGVSLGGEFDMRLDAALVRYAHRKRGSGSRG
jgi:hypothetical protein